ASAAGSVELTSSSDSHAPRRSLLFRSARAAESEGTPPRTRFARGTPRREGYRGAMDVDRFRVRPGSTVRLRHHDPSQTGGFDKAEAAPRTAELRARLGALQEHLYVDGSQKLLVVLQAIDAGGKDGTIRHVFR